MKGVYAENDHDALAKYPSGVDMSESIDALLAPGLRFLLREVCRTDQRPGASSPPDAGLPALFEEAKHHRIAGLLQQWLGRQRGLIVPASVSNGLNAMQHDNAVRALALLGQSQQLSSHLRRAGIDSLVVKGPLLSRRFYGDYASRHAGDVDLLVAPERAADADGVLRQQGYVRTKPEKALSPRRLELYLRTQHEFGYRSPQGEIPVELHWRYSDSRSLSPYSFAEIWQRSVRMEVAGEQLAVPSTADVFIHLAIHGAVDGWFRLKWIADLPRVLAGMADAEIAALLAEASHRGVARPVALALELAGYQASDAAAIFHLSASTRKILLEAVARRLRSTDEDTPGLGTKLRDTLGGYRYKMQLVESLIICWSSAFCRRSRPSAGTGSSLTKNGITER